MKQESTVDLIAHEMIHDGPWHRTMMLRVMHHLVVWATRRFSESQKLDSLTPAWRARDAPRGAAAGILMYRYCAMADKHCAMILLFFCLILLWSTPGLSAACFSNVTTAQERLPRPRQEWCKRWSFDIIGRAKRLRTKVSVVTMLFASPFMIEGVKVR